MANNKKEAQERKNFKERLVKLRRLHDEGISRRKKLNRELEVLREQIRLVENELWGF